MRKIIASAVLGVMGLLACGSNARAEDKNITMDTSALLKFFEVQKDTIDPTNGTISFVFKAKETVTITCRFHIEYIDEDGVVLHKSMLMVTPGYIGFKTGQILRGSSKLPEKRILERTRTIVVGGGPL